MAKKNKSSKTKRKKLKKEQKSREKEQIRQQILAHGDMLAENMNFRLFLEMEKTCLPNRMLFVEHVMVTNIDFPEKKAYGLCQQAKEGIQKFFRRLRSLLPQSDKKRKPEA